jgi:hypothetical protein
LKKEHRNVIDVVAAAIGQGFPPVQSPASNRTYQPPE